MYKIASVIVKGVGKMQKIHTQNEKITGMKMTLKGYHPILYIPVQSVDRYLQYCIYILLQS